jgi:hypothetical protein
MSYTNIINCEALQANLDAAWSDPRSWGGMQTAYPYAEWINAPENRRLVVDAVSPGGGKLRTVTVKGMQTISPNAVQNNVSNPNCAGEGTMAQFYKDYTIDTTQNISFGLDFNVNDFIEACDGNGAILAQAVARLIDALDERVSHLIATQSVALAGGWASTVPVESGTALSGEKLQITKATPRNYFSEITKIRNAADESNFPMESLLVGGSAIREAFQATQAGCCASTGIDLWEAMRLYGYAFAYDRHLIQAHPDGQDGAMIVAPGALQLLHISLAPNLSEFGKTVMDAANFTWDTVYSPRFGVPYDLTVSNNCGAIRLSLSFTGKMVSLPDDIYPAAHHLSGVNWAAMLELV